MTTSKSPNEILKTNEALAQAISLMNKKIIAAEWIETTIEQSETTEQRILHELCLVRLMEAILNEEDESAESLTAIMEHNYDDDEEGDEDPKKIDEDDDDDDDSDIDEEDDDDFEEGEESEEVEEDEEEDINGRRHQLSITSTVQSQFELV